MEATYKPIFFSTLMVQALLNDRKTLTRRKEGLEKINQNPDDFTFMCWRNGKAIFLDKNKVEIECKPKYNPSEILWVRETVHQNGEFGLEYKADREDIDESLIPDDFNVIIDKNGNYAFCDIPNIFMLKSFARIFLEVKDVKIERLQDITASDSEAEGIKIDESKVKLVKDINPTAQINTAKIFAFASLWNSINGKESWKKNPWVWVYEFKKIEKPEVWP